MTRRDQILTMDSESLAALCQLEFFKGSGPGGQKRNKSSSAVRVTLNEFQLSVSDCTERSQHRNRSKAIAKLQLLLALSVRQEAPEIPESPECSMTSPRYPLFAAQLFDILVSSALDHREAAQKYSISPTALLKKIARDPRLWQEYSRLRTTAGLPALKMP